MEREGRGAGGRARAWILAGVALLAARPVWADLAGAQAEYRFGLEQERARNYRLAVEYFGKSLAADARYVYADKEMGTCYYYLGDKAEALFHYDRYLAVVPSDKPVSSMAEYLRGQVSPGALDFVRRAQHPDPRVGRFGAGLLLGYNTYAMNTYNADFGKSFGDLTGGFNLGVDLKWRFDPDWVAGLCLETLFAGSSTSQTGSDGMGDTVKASVTVNAPAVLVGPYMGYVFGGLAPRLEICPLVELGYLSLAGANLTASTSATGPYAWLYPNGSGTSNFSGSGFGAKVALSADWLVLPEISLDCQLGYRYALLSTITYSGSGYGSSGSGTLQYNGTNVGLDYSGLDANLGATYWF